MTPMILVTMWFDAASESTTGDGWVLLLSDQSDPNLTPETAETRYPTLLDLLNAVQDIFSLDPSVDFFFRTLAEEDILADNQAAIDAAHEALRVAEGLDP
jgi:hypothetical protein